MNIDDVTLIKLGFEHHKNDQKENNETARTEEIEASSGTDQSKHVYFPKFLTSSSLTELQLR